MLPCLHLRRTKLISDEVVLVTRPASSASPGSLWLIIRAGQTRIVVISFCLDCPTLWAAVTPGPFLLKAFNHTLMRTGHHSERLVANKVLTREDLRAVVRGRALVRDDAPARTQELLQGTLQQQGSN